MERRTLFSALGLPALQANQESRRPAEGRRPPNVVVLMSDQHRPDLMSCRGSGLVSTPNIDRIAQRGVIFDSAFCCSPTCVPSRMSMLTGRFPQNHGAFDNSRTLDWRTRTVAHHFRDHGYLTALIGKMHFHHAHTHGFDYHIGFNDWHAYLGPRVQHVANENHSNWICGPTLKCDGCGFPEQPALFNANPWLGTVRKMTQLASELAADDHFDAFVAREASRFIRTYREEPFFLIAGFLKPHAPFYPPKEFADRLYNPSTMPLRSVNDPSSYPEVIKRQITLHQSRGDSVLRFRRAGQMGCLSFLDWCVGQVYQTLEELNLLKDTIIVYTSDHGEMDGEHGLYEKAVFFEPSVGVPLIVSRPGSIPEGKSSQSLVELTGLFPTLSDLAGLPRPGATDARSFAEVVLRPAAKGVDSVFGVMGLGRTPTMMLRTSRFKYIANSNDRSELYDLEHDPREEHNTIGGAEGRKTAAQLHESLLSIHDPGERLSRRPVF